MKRHLMIFRQMTLICAAMICIFLINKKYILQWLVGSSLAKEMASRQGYVVCAETYIELESGGICRVFEWFQEKGFKDK